MDSAFTGSTGKGRFSELSDQDLTVHSIGYQRLTARLFSLSVEEALKYKDYLWKLGDTDSDNPEAVTDNFCKWILAAFVLWGMQMPIVGMPISWIWSRNDSARGSETGWRQYR